MNRSRHLCSRQRRRRAYAFTPLGHQAPGNPNEAYIPAVAEGEFPGRSRTIKAAGVMMPAAAIRSRAVVLSGVQTGCSRPPLQAALHDDGRRTVRQRCAMRCSPGQSGRLVSRLRRQPALSSRLFDNNRLLPDRKRLAVNFHASSLLTQRCLRGDARSVEQQSRRAVPRAPFEAKRSLNQYGRIT